MITILTPTYNRAANLKDLFKSLTAQTSFDFDWLIVDDGSTDNTKELVSEFAAQSNFEIRYIYKQNGGKHTALNLGIKAVERPLTFIVDSDDILTDDAVENIIYYAKKYENIKNELCGFSFLRSFPDGKINGSEFVKDEWVISYIDARINSGDTSSDKAEVYYTECLKEFPFPEFEGERFLGEDIVWLRMGRKYKTVHINKAIYISSYLDDGLTQNRRAHNIKSPLGCTERAKEFLHSDIRLKYRLKPSLQYIIYGRFAKKSLIELIKNSPMPLLSVISAVPAMILYLKWKRENQ